MPSLYEDMFLTCKGAPAPTNAPHLSQGFDVTRITQKKYQLRPLPPRRPKSTLVDGDKINVLMLFQRPKKLYMPHIAGLRVLQTKRDTKSHQHLDYLDNRSYNRIALPQGFLGILGKGSLRTSNTPWF